MGRSRRTEKFMGLNQDSTSLSVAPEVLRTSRGADAPAFVALRWTGLLEQYQFPVSIDYFKDF